MRINAIFFAVFFVAQAGPLLAQTEQDKEILENTENQGAFIVSDDTESEKQDVHVSAGQDQAEASQKDGGKTEEISDVEISSEPQNQDFNNLKQEIAPEKLPEIEVIMSTQAASIGELVKWELVVDKIGSSRILLPSKLDFGKFEIQSNQSFKEEGTGEFKIVIGLLSFETGFFEIPQQKISIIDEKGRLSQILSPKFEVEIKSLLANEPEASIKEDSAQGEVVMVEDKTLLYVLLFVAATIIIALLTLLIRKLWSMRRPKTLPPPPPPRPAKEVVLEKLNELKESSYLEEQKHKEFHFKLSEAFREYIGRRYDFDCLEMSTSETARALKQCNISFDLEREMVDFLEETDLVKFAKFIPSTQRSLFLLEEAYRYVEITTPALEVKIDEELLNETGDEVK